MHERHIRAWDSDCVDYLVIAYTSDILSTVFVAMEIVSGERALSHDLVVVVLS